MGAQFDSKIAVGKTPAEAFRSAVDSARWEHGHGGYSGTIAEKHEFVSVVLPKGMTASKFMGLVEDGTYQFGVLAEPTYYSASDLKQAQRFVKNLPASARPSVERAAKIVGDKWGPAVCVELRGTDAVNAKKRLGVAGKRVSAYVFFGECPS